MRRALRDHCCKQLATIILDYLCPEVDEFIRRHRPGKPWEKLPGEVLNAVHLIVHEKIPKERDRWWIGSDERPLAQAAKAAADGKVDRRKQDAVYVDVGAGDQCP